MSASWQLCIVRLGRPPSATRLLLSMDVGNLLATPGCCWRRLPLAGCMAAERLVRPIAKAPRERLQFCTLLTGGLSWKVSSIQRWSSRMRDSCEFLTLLPQSTTERQRPEPSCSSNATAPPGLATFSQRWLDANVPPAPTVHGRNTVRFAACGAGALRASDRGTTPPPQKFLCIVQPFLGSTVSFGGASEPPQIATDSPCRKASFYFSLCLYLACLGKTNRLS
jgi:hypothetical protein